MRGRRCKLPPPETQGKNTQELVESLKRFDEEIEAHVDRDVPRSGRNGFYHVTCASRVHQIAEDGLDYFADPVILERVQEDPSPDNIYDHRLYHITEEILEETRRSLQDAPEFSRREIVSFWPNVDTAAFHIHSESSTTPNVGVLRIEPQRFKNETLWIGDYQTYLDLQEAVEELSASQDLDTVSYLIECMGVPTELTEFAAAYWRDVVECESPEATYDVVNDTRHRIPEVLFNGTVPWNWFTGGVSSGKPISDTEGTTPKHGWHL